MRQEDFENFKDRIWTTKTARINAERRLLKKESFIQGLNIYYSCIGIFFSIMTLIKEDQKLSIATVFISIALLAAILYSNSQKNLENAKDYKRNYIDMTEIEFRLKHVDICDEITIQKIEKEYCELLQNSCNHIEFDYQYTVFESKGEYREKNWKKIRGLFWWNMIWRSALKIFVLVFPLIIYCVCEGL